MFFQRPLLRQLSRLMLVWYVLFVGVSVLAATLQPKTTTNHVDLLMKAGAQHYYVCNRMHFPRHDTEELHDA